MGIRSLLKNNDSKDLHYDNIDSDSDTSSSSNEDEFDEPNNNDVNCQPIYYQPNLYQDDYYGNSDDGHDSDSTHMTETLDDNDSTLEEEQPEEWSPINLPLIQDDQSEELSPISLHIPARLSEEDHSDSVLSEYGYYESNAQRWIPSEDDFDNVQPSCSYENAQDPDLMLLSEIPNYANNDDKQETKSKSELSPDMFDDSPEDPDSPISASAVFPRRRHITDKTPKQIKKRRVNDTNDDEECQCQLCSKCSHCGRTRWQFLEFIEAQENPMGESDNNSDSD